MVIMLLIDTDKDNVAQIIMYCWGKVWIHY